MVSDLYTRLHDLLIEKTELQENLESLKKEYDEKIKSLVQENDYLSEVVGELKKCFQHVTSFHFYEW